MPGKRDTDSDMGRSSRSSILTPKEVTNVLNRLDKTKADKIWAESEFKMKAQSHGFLEKKVEEIAVEVSELTDSGVTIGNKASEARRIAKVAEKAANADHECLHKQTMDNISRDVAMATEKVDSWDGLFKKTMSRITKIVIGATVIVSGALVTWLVMFSNLSRDVDMLTTDTKAIKESDTEQDVTLENLKDRMERNHTKDLQVVMTAFEKVLDVRDREAAKTEDKSKGRNRKPRK